MRLPIVISLFLLSLGGLSAQDSATPQATADTSAALPARWPPATTSDTTGGWSGLSDTTLRRLSDFPAQPSTCRTYGAAVAGYVEAHPYFAWLGRPVYLISRERRPPATDWIFYTLLATVLFFGILRQAYGRYLTDLSVAFFELAIRQAPLREQLARQTLPSLLLNLLFVFNTALFIRLAVPGLRWPAGGGHASVIGGLALLIAAVYLGKQWLLRAAGWLSGRSADAEGYLFIVMMVNKVAGIALIPMNLLQAYLGREHGTTIGITAIVLFSALLVFRILRCYAFVSRELRFSLWTFLLSMASFEVMPMLVIAKLAAGLFPGK
jgi:hypothetical protein